jgi:hypothetical protein
MRLIIELESEWLRSVNKKLSDYKGKMLEIV